MIEALWRRHYHVAYGEYHRDMAMAFKAMLADPDCDSKARAQMQTAIRIHIGLEHDPRYTGRKCFTEVFSDEQK